MLYLLIILILTSSSSIHVSSKSPSKNKNLPDEITSSRLSKKGPLPPSTISIHQPTTLSSVEQTSTVTATFNHLQPGETSGSSWPEPAVELPASAAPFPPANHHRNTASSSCSASQPPNRGNPTPDPPYDILTQESQPQGLPVQDPPPRNPQWYHLNPLLAVEGDNNRIPPNQFHRMDFISLCVMNYFFSGGLSNTAVWTQNPTLSTSIYIQCFLNQIAFSLFILANIVFPRTRPMLAFVIDRMSFFLIVFVGYLSNMPMYHPFFAIIMLLVVSFTYIFTRYRR